ncbi:alternative oxidase [Pseudonocardia xishanensis]|uniref:Alternative oxidase n=1 Tax=Pseudonocardia xishanensis TaxID=630995 RepID=A0ABP8S1T5_9PSEU
MRHAQHPVGLEHGIPVQVGSVPRPGGMRTAPGHHLRPGPAHPPPLPDPRWGGPRTVHRPVPTPPVPSGRMTAAATPRLGRRALRREQLATLAAPRRRYSLLARLLFVTMDLLYGRRRTLAKFQVLEIVARIPYQIWENAAYRLLTRRHRDAALARRIHERIEENREQQDNEQWHLLIVGELVAVSGARLGRLRFRVLPLLLALTYYHLAWLMFVLAPRWSYRLNADFEDHAEHEYAEFVAERPELETVSHRSQFADRYGAHASVADLLRQIGHDERMHKHESERYLAEGGPA